MFNLVALLALLVPASGALSSPPVLPVDGEPFFVLGWYTGYLSPSVEASRQYLSTMRHQGMNTALICYGIIYYDPHMTNQLEGAVDADMKIMVEVNRRAVQQLPGYPLSLIDYQVDLCAPYQSLLGWYLIDEPEGNGVTPSMAQTGYARVKTRDPNRPISVAHMAYAGQPAVQYLNAEPPPYCDVLMTDTYIVYENDPEFTSNLFRNALQSRIHTQLAVDHAKQAYINIVQAFGCCEKWRIPTPAETRYLSYAPVVEGARGLLYWMHSDDYTTPEQRDIVVPQTAHEIQSLVPAIMANSTAVSVSSNRDTDTTGHGVADVCYLFAADGGAGYLIAVNNTATAWPTTFQLTGDVLPGALGSTSVSIPVLFEQREVLLQPTADPNAWTLSDTFSPYDVNVYRIYGITNSGTMSELPAKVIGVHPADQSTSVGRIFDLTWAPTARATSYDLYFGAANPPPFRGNQANTIFDPGVMTLNTAYYWRIDAVNNQGVTTGDTVVFTTVKLSQATNPRPADQAPAVWPGVQLSWLPGTYAMSFDVYFGPSNPPEFRSHQTATTYDPSPLTPHTPYFWRIDSFNESATTQGNLWTFTTRAWETSIDLGTTDNEQGLKRVVVSDGDTTPAAIGARDARKNLDPANDLYFYFDVDDLFAYQGSRPEVFITIDYYDVGTGSLTLQYDAAGSGNAYKSGGSVALTGTNMWKQYVYHVTDAYLGNRQNGGADFRIAKGGGSFFYLDVVAISGEQPPLPPDQAATPNPPDGATGVSRNADLSWYAARATSYDVYFGPISPPAFQGNQTQTTFDPAALMDPLTTYFWRIDSINSFGTTTGVVWQFTTRSFNGDLNGDLDVDQEDFGKFQVCLSGPGVAYESGCEGADFNSDNDVDLDDFNLFQMCIGGANKPPNC